MVQGQNRPPERDNDQDGECLVCDYTGPTKLANIGLPRRVHLCPDCYGRYNKSVTAEGTL